MREQRITALLVIALSLLGAGANARAEDDEDARPVVSAAQYAADLQSSATLTVGQSIYHDTLPSLRATPVLPFYGPRGIHFEGLLPLPPGSANQIDGAVQGPGRGPLASTPAPISTVLGIGNGGPGGSQWITGTPPDTNGAIGSSQYVQSVNGSLVVLDKATKAVVYGPAYNNTLWSGVSAGQCDTRNDGDPVVAYDKAADRWVITQFSVPSNSGPDWQCVAVSQTNDATGAWNRYVFQYAGFNDYGKLGVWPDAYYMTFNMFGGESGAKLCAFDRAAMLAGAGTATQQCFQLAGTVGGVLPSDLDGSTAPPAGSPNYLMNFGTNSLNLWKFHVDWANTANTTLSGPTSIPVAAFSPACNGGSCIPQPKNGHKTSPQLDTLADRLMFRLAYRNFGDHESLVVSHSVVAGAGSALRWYEIRDPSGTPNVYQQSTYAPDNVLYRWMPSIAMDKFGNIALGYSTSSTTAFPSIAYTGRLAADTLNTMGAEVQMANGTGVETYFRWGDYSAMTVDPVDDCTFWYTNEYMLTTGEFTWDTSIGSFRFPGCGAASYTLTYTAGANGTISGTSPQIVPAGGDGTAVTAVPNTGYHFVKWSDNSTANPRTDTNVQADVTVSATFAIDTHTLTYTAGANGSISGTTPQTVNYGASGTPVTAVPSTGYHFVKWSDNSTANPRTDTNVQADITVSATFAIDTHTLTYTAGANGSISGTTPQTVNYGGSGTPVTAVANTGYHFVKWSDNSTANPRTDTNVQADVSVTATFAINTYTLTYTASANGSISGTTPQTVNYGAGGTAVTAVPNTGYHFVKWSDNSTVNPRTDTNVQADITVSAAFAIDTHTVTPSTSGNGTINPNTPQSVNYGSTKTFVLTPAAGNHIVNVSGTCGGTLTANSFTTAAVTTDCTVVANFAANPPTLVFTTQPSTVVQGDVLGTVQVTEKDSITGSTINDNASTVDFTITICGGTLDLGTVPMSGGVATLNSTQRFYTTTSGTPLTIAATTATLNATSANFGVSGNTGLLFSNGYEVCRP